jgi:signal peptidase I
MPANFGDMQIKSWWLRLVAGRRPSRTLLRVLLLAIVCFTVFKFLFMPVFISGDSMYPTYRDGRLNFVNRWSYVWSEPQRGEVVAVKTSGMRIMYLKRIVGLPGETLSIRNGVVWIDGEPLEERYVYERQRWRVPRMKLAAGEYFVIGDNRSMDRDRHYFGRVQGDRIVGKVMW